MGDLAWQPISFGAGIAGITSTPHKSLAIQQLGPDATKEERKALKSQQKQAKAATVTTRLICKTAPAELCQNIFQGLRDLPLIDIKGQKKLAKDLQAALKYAEFPTQLVLEFDKTGIDAVGLLDSLPVNLKGYLKDVPDLSKQGRGSLNLIVQSLQICAACQQYRAGKIDGITATAIVVKAAAKTLKVSSKLLGSKELKTALPYVGVTGRLAHLVVKARSGKSSNIDVLRAAVDFTSALSTATGHNNVQLEVASAALGIISLLWTDPATESGRPQDAISDPATFYKLQHKVWHAIQQPQADYTRDHPLEFFSSDIGSTSGHMGVVDPGPYREGALRSHNEYQLLHTLENFCVNMKKVDPLFGGRPPYSVLMSELQAIIDKAAENSLDQHGQLVLLRAQGQEIINEIHQMHKVAASQATQGPPATYHFKTATLLHDLEKAQNCAQVASVIRICIEDLQTNVELPKDKVKPLIAKLRHIEWATALAMDAARHQLTAPIERLMPTKASDTINMLYLGLRSKQWADELFGTQFSAEIAKIQDPVKRLKAQALYLQMRVASAGAFQNPAALMRFWQNMNIKYLPAFDQLRLLPSDTMDRATALEDECARVLGEPAELALYSRVILSSQAKTQLESIGEEILDYLEMKGFMDADYQALAIGFREMTEELSEALSNDELLEMLPRIRTNLLEPLEKLGLIYKKDIKAWEALEKKAIEWVVPDSVSDASTEEQKLAFVMRNNHYTLARLFNDSFFEKVISVEDKGSEILQTLERMAWMFESISNPTMMFQYLYQFQSKVIPTLLAKNLLSEAEASMFNTVIVQAEELLGSSTSFKKAA